MKTITSSFYTTTNKYSFRDVWKYIFVFKKNDYVNLAEQKFGEYLFEEKREWKNICSFYNARSALFHGLHILEIGEGDEVIIQAYTCVSVPNSIIHTGARPIYVDVDQTLNMDPKLIEKQITRKTKAIMIQHTFGNPANIYKIQEICKKHKLLLIEDCAHSLGAEYHGKKIGTFGDISFFSFGRDKVISTVNGGMLVVNNKKFINKLPLIKKKLKNPPRKLIIQNIFYLIISYLSDKTYDFWKFGKAMIYVSRKLKLIPEILSKEEKSCHDTTFYYRYPQALAYVAIGELQRVAVANLKRMAIAQKYYQLLKGSKLMKTIKIQEHSKSIFLRFPLFIKNLGEITKKAKQQKILLGNRYQQVIAPENVNYSNAMYRDGSCPYAEKLASQTVNLPCHPNLNTQDLERVLSFIQKV